MTYQPGTWKRLAPGYYSHLPSGAVVHRVNEQVRVMVATAKGTRTKTLRRAYWCVEGHKQQFDTADEAMRFAESISTDPKGNA